MEIIHNRLLNNQFAPGIATYGIDGKDGERGPAGTSIYFTSYSLSDFNQYNDALVKINQNKILSEFVDQESYREYNIGDLVLDPLGKIYRLVKKNGAFSLTYVSEVIGLTDSNYFNITSNNRVSIDSRYKGFDIAVGESTSTFVNNNTTDYPLRIANSKEDTKTGNFNLISLLARPTLGEEKSLNISYNKNNDSFVFETDSNIVIDTNILSVSSSQEENPSLGEYYRISPYNDPIGLVHKIFVDATWRKDNNNIVIENIDNAPYESIGMESRDISVKVMYSDKTEDIKAASISDNKIEIVLNSPSKEISLVSIIKGIEIFIKKN